MTGLMKIQMAKAKAKAKAASAKKRNLHAIRHPVKHGKVAGPIGNDSPTTPPPEWGIYRPAKKG
jgi:hypothetical protein